MARGTIKGKVQIKIKEPDDTYSTRPFVCVRVKTTNRSTHTKDTGWYSISDEAGRHTLRLLVETKTGFEVEIASEEVTFDPNNPLTKDFNFDVEESQDEVRDVLEKIIIKRDPGLPGCVSGKVKDKDTGAIIPGAAVYITGVVQTYSDEEGRYGLCVPGDESYVLRASHDNYRNWSWPFTIAELGALNKLINMTHK